jgi:hypothetical protein
LHLLEGLLWGLFGSGLSLVGFVSARLQLKSRPRFWRQAGRQSALGVLLFVGTAFLLPAEFFWGVVFGLLPGIPIAVASWSLVARADRGSASEGAISALAAAVASGLMVETLLLTLGVVLYLGDLTPAFVTLTLAIAFDLALAGIVLRWAPTAQAPYTFRGWQVGASVVNLACAMLAFWIALVDVRSIDTLALVAVAVVTFLIAIGQWHFVRAPHAAVHVPV